MGQTVKKSWTSAGLLAAGLWAVLGFSCCVPARAQQPVVDKLVLDDTIQPVSADEVTRALDRANSDGAQALLIDLDTPGGLLDSMRTMVGAILRSRVPVIVYVAPSGSRAGSAGFFLLESADVAAMAPGTEAGAAHRGLRRGQARRRGDAKGGERCRSLHAIVCDQARTQRRRSASRGAIVALLHGQTRR